MQISPPAARQLLDNFIRGRWVSKTVIFETTDVCARKRWYLRGAREMMAGNSLHCGAGFQRIVQV